MSCSTAEINEMLDELKHREEYFGARKWRRGDWIPVNVVLKSRETTQPVLPAGLLLRTYPTSYPYFRKW